MLSNLKAAGDVITQDLWVHIAGIIAIAVGFAGWYSTGLSHDPSSVELMFMIGGLAGLGIKIINGSATVLAANTAANVVAQAAASAAQVVAQAQVAAASATPATPAAPSPVNVQILPTPPPPATPPTT